MSQPKKHSTASACTLKRVGSALCSVSDCKPPFNGKERVGEKRAGLAGRAVRPGREAGVCCTHEH